MKYNTKETIDKIIDSIFDDIEEKFNNTKKRFDGVIKNECSEESDTVILPIPAEYQIDSDDSDELMIAVDEQLARLNESFSDYHELTNHRIYTYAIRYPFTLLVDSISIVDNEIIIEYNVLKEEFYAGNYWDSLRISKEEYNDLVDGTDIDFYYEDED